MNNCTFIGRLVSDPELIEVNDTNVVRFTLAINEYRRQKDGTKKRKTDYFDFEAWDSGATTISKYCFKGDEIAVSTTARQNRWEDKEGNKKSQVRFRVNNFKLFGKRPSSNSENNNESSERTEQTAEAPF